MNSTLLTVMGWVLLGLIALFMLLVAWGTAFLVWWGIQIMKGRRDE